MISQFKTLRDNEAGVFVGKRVLLRLDLNLPLKDGLVVDDYRLRRSLPTLNFLRRAGAKIIILSHLSDSNVSLKPIAEYLNSKFMPGVEVLENLRRDPGEEKNDAEFAGRLARLGDIFINDAFSVSHREHASIVSLPKLLPSYAGLLFEEEIKNLSRLLAPQRPFIVVLGGIKFSTKISSINKFLESADKIFIGGALANSFLKARGQDVGESIVDEDLELLKLFLNHPKIILPNKVVRADNKIVDIAPESFAVIADELANARIILWNGPMGNFENNFIEGTKKLAELITSSKAFSVIGGGDTVAALSKLNLLEKFGFVSTGGGAMLEFLARGTLPGIEALARR